MTALYAIPIWLLLALAIVVAAGLACAGQLVVRRLFPGADFRAHNEVAGIVLGIIGGLFGVTLAFIIAIVWQEFDATHQRVAVESSAAADLYHTASGLPAPVGPNVRRNLVAYAKLLVEDEWPAMRSGGSWINVFAGSFVQPSGAALVTITQLDPISVAFSLPQRNLGSVLASLRSGGSSARAEQLLTQTYRDIAQFHPRDMGASNAQAAALVYVGVLHDARHHRLDDNDSGVSPFEWSILGISAVIIVGLCYLVGFPDVRTQLLMTGALAAMIAVMFTLIFELDYPFRGDLAIAPVGWQAFFDENKEGV